jgi:bifunctional ADP-heptose synthase (sugar kinase/adenylyltransferase)
MARGGRVERISIVPGASTTEIIERIASRYARH